MIVEHLGKTPNIHPTAYVAPNTAICGDVTVGENSRILFGASVVAEGGSIRIGTNCIIMENAATIKPNDEHSIRLVIEALIASGIAMGIAGSSRPASGAEHLISHGLDKILKNRGLHGTQSGIATIFSLCLRGSDGRKEIKKFYKKLSLPQKPEDIGITKEMFLEAVKIAPSTRKNRFTILDIKGKDKKLLSDVYDEVCYS